MTSNFQHHALGTARPSHNDWVERAARVGYLTKGVVYALLGSLSITAALQGGQPQGGQGAIREIGAQPFGQILLVLVAIGLGGYALWRFVQLLLDPENVGNDAKGWTRRIGYGLSGVSHLALAFLAVQLIDGGGGGSEQSSKTWLAELLRADFGAVIVGILGVFVIGVGLRQLYKAKTTKFKEELKMHEMSPNTQRAAVIVGRVGLAARGVVFPIIGYFLLRAAITNDAWVAKGLGGALTEISQSAGGNIALLVVAIGLVAYGVYQFVLAKYRKMPS